MEIPTFSAGLSDEDKLFAKAIVILNDIKLVRGGQALYGTLRKRKVLKAFLENYVSGHYPTELDDLEESIVSLK